MNEKLLNMSSSPHIRHRLTTGAVMTDVVLALLPAAVFGIYRYGIHAFLILLISPLTDQAHLTAVFEKQWQQALQLEEWDSIRMEQENLSDLRSRVLTEACQKEVQRQIEETADGEGMKGTKVKVVFQSEETEGIRKVTISGGYEDLQQKEAVQEQILQKLWEIYQISSDKVVFLGG